MAKPTSVSTKDTKTPSLASPTASKSSPGASAAVAKQDVKLPSIGAPPVSPAKSKKTELGGSKGSLSLPSGEIKAAVPTPPSKTSKLKTINASPPKNGKGVKSALPAPTRAPPDAIPETAAELLLSVETQDDQARAEADAHVQAAAEANALAQAQNEAAQAAAVAEAEAQRVRREIGSGMVKLIYEQYDELFPIVDGSTTQAAIDEVYCLSFVMPNCLVHLSYHPHTERFERENRGVYDSLVHEEPRGTYHELVNDQTYYVVVEQEADQLRRDQDATRAKWAPTIRKDKEDTKDDGRGFESCSCIYGNPCVDEYGCKDWHGRFAIATANGWKGF